MVGESVRDGFGELLCGRHFVIGECDRHAPLRQLDRQWRGNRQSIFRHVNQKQIARFDVGRARCQRVRG